LVQLGSFKFDKVVFYTLYHMSEDLFDEEAKMKKIFMDFLDTEIHELKNESKNKILEIHNKLHGMNNKIHDVINEIQETNKNHEATNKFHEEYKTCDAQISFLEARIPYKNFNNDTRIPVWTSYSTSDFIQLCKYLPAENCSLDFRHYPKTKGFTQKLRIIAKEVKISELTTRLKLQDYANYPMELIEDYDFVEVLNIYLVFSYDESFINEQKKEDETTVPNLSAFDQFKNSISSLMIERKDKNERLKKVNLFIFNDNLIPALSGQQLT